MKCMNCGAEIGGSAYCPSCGKDVSVQKQAAYLSELYYNRGLEKAQIRDLTGAIELLKQSLKFNKLNVTARNLLGLAYFEVGEVVSALSEWVISKNIQPMNNPAEDYITDLRQNSGKLDEINETIKKFNIALQNCLEGNEDVAEIQLKKILIKNPKLIKGYHLLALLYINKKDYERARRLLVKAARIDRTNTTTLRFLKEVDEQTGKVTSLEPRWKILARRGGKGNYPASNTDPEAYQDNGVIQPSSYREITHQATFLSILLGLVIGAAAIWFIVVPARTAQINKRANETVAGYSTQVATMTAELDRMNTQMESSQETVDTANAQIAEANKKADSSDNLLKAYTAFSGGNSTLAVNYLVLVDYTLLTAEAQGTYDNMLPDVKDALFAGLKEAGNTAYQNQEYDTAITRLENARRINGMDYGVLNTLSLAYTDGGNTEKADEINGVISSNFTESDIEAYISAEADGASQVQADSLDGEDS